MSAREDGGPAFARPIDGQVGMSLRDYFAAAALTAIVSRADVYSAELGKAKNSTPLETFSVALAYLYADAMLVERAK